MNIIQHHRSNIFQVSLLLLSYILCCNILTLTMYSTVYAHDDHQNDHTHDDGHDHSDETNKKYEDSKYTIHLTEEAINTAKISIEKATNKSLSMQLKVNGQLAPISSNVAHIASRFSGVIREVRKDVGDIVAPGDVLVIVESNQNLQKFEVRALQGGIVTDRHATIGESIAEDEALFVVMELSKLWADFTVFQRDISRVSIGQTINIQLPPQKRSPEHTVLKNTITFISPLVDQSTQSRIVRTVINNSNAELSPGTFISALITTDEYKVPVAVTYDAIQTVDSKKVVFVYENNAFIKREISLGRSDGTYTEVLSGIEEGESYAASNTFILKAELGKRDTNDAH